MGFKSIVLQEHQCRGFLCYRVQPVGKCFYACQSRMHVLMHEHGL